MTATVHRAPVSGIPSPTLYRILWLRVTVFVVEQQAAYPEIDGRDVEPGAELMWAADGDDVLATLRLLREPANTRIGRVATAAAARGRGIAADLMRSAVAHLDAEAPGIPLVAYPNTGETWDAATRTWHGGAAPLADDAPAWVAAGARLVGGCCRSTPSDIAGIAAAIR